MKKLSFPGFISICMIIVLAVIMLFGCNPQKKVQNAMNVVKFNDTAFTNIGLLWERFHPCANDTVTVRDTTSIPIFMDADINTDSLRRIICDTSRHEPVIVRVPCPPQKVIKIVNTVRDTRHEQILRDSLDHERDRRRSAEATSAGDKKTIQDLRDAQSAQTKDFAKALTKRTLVMLIPIVLLLIIAFLLLKKKTGIL